MEDLRVPPQELRDGGLADTQLPEVIENGDHVLLDAATKNEGIIVDVFYGEAEGVEEIDALPHDIDGDGELEAVELVRDDAEPTEELVEAGAVGGALVLHLEQAGPSIEGRRRAGGGAAGRRDGGCQGGRGSCENS